MLLQQQPQLELSPAQLVPSGLLAAAVSRQLTLGPFAEVGFSKAPLGPVVVEMYHQYMLAFQSAIVSLQQPLGLVVEVICLWLASDPVTAVICPQLVPGP